MKQNDVRFMLANGATKLVFNKKDGSIREMLATTESFLIPEEEHPKGEGRKTNDEVCCCYDIQNRGWRSFRWDSLISVNGQPFED